MSQMKDVLGVSTDFIYHRIEDEENERPQVLALKLIGEFFSDLKNKLEGCIEDTILMGDAGHAKANIKGFKEVVDKNEINSDFFDDNYIYVLLTKKIPEEQLNALLLSMDSYEFCAIFVNNEGQVITQGYDNGEYDTGYFSDEKHDMYIENEMWIERYNKAKEILLNQ